MIVFSVGDYIRVRNVCMRTQQAAPNIGHVHAYVHASQEDAKVTYNAQKHSINTYIFFVPWWMVLTAWVLRMVL